MNARFWTWVNDGLVKITLREGESLHHFKVWEHEEGWSSEAVQWSLEDGLVTREAVNDGRDCDGRLTRNYSDVCPVDLLRHMPDYETPGYFVPAWTPLESSQRDYSAEAAGY